jgi:hypothetical protein
MSALASKIAAKRAERERKHVDVEEWGDDGEPVRLYFTDVSARDIEKVQRKHANFISNPTMASMVETIILKCEDEGGDPAFTLEDKPVLMGEPIGVIAKVFGAVFSAPSIEEQEKN